MALLQDYSVLAPFEGVIRVPLAREVIPLESVTVEIPVDFRDSNGTATLRVPDGTVASITISAPDPLPTFPDCDASGNCDVVGLLECQLESEPSVTECDGVVPEVYLRVAGQERAVVGARRDLLFVDSTTYSKVPRGPWSCGSGYDCESLVAQAQAQRAVWAVPALFSVFSSHYYFRVSGGALNPKVATYQETDWHPGSAPCVSDGTTTVTAGLSELGHSVTALHDWELSGVSAATVGTEEAFSEPTQRVVLPPSEAGDESQASVYKYWQEADVSALRNQEGLLRGNFESQLDSAYQSGNGDPGGIAYVPGFGAFNRWSPSEESATAAGELMSGTEYSLRADGSMSSYGFKSGTYFRLTYDNREC